MSVATLRPPAALYREEQSFAWWVYVLMAVLVSAGCSSLAWHPIGREPVGRGPWLAVPLALAMGLVLPSILIVGVLRMTTEVDPVACRVWFGIVPTYRRAIPLDLIKAVEVTTYRPIRDHWFWGVRTARDGERVMTARGDRGVRLLLADGSRILIGSQRPEELAEALHRALRAMA